MRNMSIANFGEDSDVFVYRTFSGHHACASCKLNPIHDYERGGVEHISFGSVYMDTKTDLLLHLQEHVSAGHKVPGEVLYNLEKDISVEAQIKELEKQISYKNFTLLT